MTVLTLVLGAGLVVLGLLLAGPGGALVAAALAWVQPCRRQTAGVASWRAGFRGCGG